LHTLLGRHLGFTDDRVTTFRVDPPFTTTNLPFARLDVASPRVLVEPMLRYGPLQLQSGRSVM
jgi:hypothetical protein